jgi:hypothetical protein
MEALGKLWDICQEEEDTVKSQETPSKDNLFPAEIRSKNSQA